MNYKNLSENFSSNGNLHEDLLNEIISVAYGDAGLLTKIKIKNLAKRNKTVADTLQQYVVTAKSVSEIDLEKCPEELIKKVHLKTDGKIKEEKSFLFDFYSVFFAKPAISAAATAVLVFVIVLSSFFNDGINTSPYTQSELETAERQTKEAISIVSRIFAKTKTTLENEVLAQKVSDPINRGINTINELFIQGGENEKVN